VSNSLELDQTPSYSASYQDPSCLQRLLQLRFLRYSLLKDIAYIDIKLGVYHKQSSLKAAIIFKCSDRSYLSMVNLECTFHRWSLKVMNTL